jgi:phytoene dehydrogenase-like protein
MSSRVVVIGAGIAGLTAARLLRDAGVDATVVEREERVGGRMRTVHLGGFKFDVGAQFLPSAYRVIPVLLRRPGLAWEPARPHVAVVRDGRLRRYRSDRPWTPLTGGVSVPENCRRRRLTCSAWPPGCRGAR